MAYADPRHIRRNIIKIRVNDAEREVLSACANLARKQMGTLAYEWLRAEMKRRTQRNSDSSHAA